MTTLFHTLESSLSLKITSEPRVYMDGHPIITHNYNIFLDGKYQQKHYSENDKLLRSAISTDPDFLGTITFEKPGHIFTYAAGDGRTLDPTEVEEVVEYLSHIRDNPSLWRTAGEL